MWRDDGKIYAALAAGTADRRGKLLVWDVSCISDSSPCLLPASKVYDTTAIAETTKFPFTLNISKTADGTPYLYAGSTEIAGPCTAQREFLYDATDPFNLHDITPQTYQDGYWGWYYQGCSTGYNYAAPRHAVILGNILYRAAFGFADSHEIMQQLIFEDGFESSNSDAWL
jgi:hypothetical protein